MDRIYPERTYVGRDRISLFPRWVANWLTTAAVIYFMGSYILRFAGFDNIGFDPFAGRAEAAVAAAQAVNTPLPNYPLNSQGSFASSSNPNVSSTSTPFLGGSAGIQQVIQPTFTPLPTYTPYPTQRPIFGTLISIGYSYYWPPFGPPNCSSENWKVDLNYCADMTASGLPWSDYVGRGVAVPVQWRENIPLGSTVRVHSPKEMVGDYLVLDFCGGCIKPEGHIYFDFLDNRQRLAWTVPMLVEIIKP